MKKHSWINDDVDDFLLAIAEAKNLAEARAFLGDVLSKKELQDCANRWKTAKMLYFGISYSKIQKATGMSSATIAKIGKILEKGMGGYRLMIAKIEK